MVKTILLKGNNKVDMLSFKSGIINPM